MLNLSRLERENFGHLYGDIFWYGIFNGTTLSFWGVYAAHLGANPFQIGLLSSGPGLVNLFLSLPAVFILEKTFPERATFISSLFNRVVYMLLIMLPWFHSSLLQIWLIVLVAIVSAIPGTTLTIGANLMLGEVVTTEWRAMVIGRRNALLSVSITFSLLLSGLVLEKVAFPVNYQFVFTLGVIGAGVSSYHLAKVISQRRMEAGKQPVQPFIDAIRQSYLFIKTGIQAFLQAGLLKMLRLDLLKGPFGPFMASYTIFYLVIALTVPIYTLFLVDTIRISDGSISLGNAIFYVAMILSSLLLARVSKWLGHHWALILSSATYFLYPFVGSLAHGPIVFYIASVLGGASWGIASGAVIARLFERTPATDWTASMAHYNLALNLGTLLGVFAGSGLAEWLGLRTSLMVSGVMRLAGTLVLIFWG